MIGRPLPHERHEPRPGYEPTHEDIFEALMELQKRLEKLEQRLR